MKDIQKLKYTDDNTEEYKDLLLEAADNTKYYMSLLSDSLMVTSSITPSIASVIESVVKRLNLQEVSIEAYIYSDSEMNARCFYIHDKIIIILTSALVNKMTKPELSFVIGHEIGHYIFGHLKYSIPNDVNSELLEMKMNKLSQAHEISADRLGLICSGSVESSVRAIVKTVSGLDDAFISSSLHAYLHQVQALNFDMLSHGNYSHPIFPIRARALVLFSMSDIYYWWKETDKVAPLIKEKLDSKIRKDLESTTLKRYKERSSHILEKFKLWFLVKSFIDDERLDEEEISYLKNIFGKNTALKAITFAKDSPDAVRRKYDEYKIQIEQLSSVEKLQLIQEMEQSIGKINRDHSIHRYFLNFKNSI